MSYLQASISHFESSFCKIIQSSEQIMQKYYDKYNKEMSERKTTDLAYDRVKEELFHYLKNNIPLQSIELDKVQYYDYERVRKRNL